MISFIILIVMLLSTLGYGMLVLCLIGVLSAPSWAEDLGRAFALGMGILGWLVFWFGISGMLELWVLWGLLIPGLFAIIYMREKLRFPSFSKLNILTLIVLFVLLFTVLLDFMEALAPPADADTLAYHFALPKLFLNNGIIEFVPIAVQGAIPLMTHMNYLMALGLGGELALTLWSFTTQIIMVLALYGVGRRWLSREWSLVLVLVFSTTPAVIYGGGSGHMEVRMALYMLIGAMSAAEGVKNRSTGLIILAGLMAGFFMGSKYYGLFAATGIGVVILMQKNFLKPVLLYTGIALLIGSQWYGWNWWHSGMPVFPSLYHFMGSPVSPYWNESIHKIFTEAYTGFVCVPANMTWLFWYPFATTLFPESCWDSGRVGLGPFFLLLLPGILAVMWKNKNQIKSSVLFYTCLPALIYYVLWFLIPSNQMTRHLLPVYPIMLLVAIASLTKKNVNYDHQWWYQSLLKMSAIVCVLMGLGVHSLFALNYAKYISNSESREQFYLRNVGYYNVVKWINDNLTSSDRIINPIRYNNYLFEVPYFYLNDSSQPVIGNHSLVNSVKFIKQLEMQRISHILICDTMAGEMLSSVQYQELKKINTVTYSSRTLGVSDKTSCKIFQIKK